MSYTKLFFLQSSINRWRYNLAFRKVFVGDALPVSRVSILIGFAFPDFVENIPAVSFLCGVHVSVLGILFKGVCSEDQALDETG